MILNYRFSLAKLKFSVVNDRNDKTLLVAYREANLVNRTYDAGIIIICVMEDE